jgi:hypothetical protein
MFPRRPLSKAKQSLRLFSGRRVRRGTYVGMRHGHDKVAALPPSVAFWPGVSVRLVNLVVWLGGVE